MKPLIKICGIKNLNEAKSVCECEFNAQRVDFIGVIFAQSKRQVSLEMAKNIADLAHKFGIKVVGVFAEIEFDQYRIIRDKLYQSDFDRLLCDATDDK